MLTASSKPSRCEGAQVATAATWALSVVVTVLLLTVGLVARAQGQPAASSVELTGRVLSPRGKTITATVILVSAKLRSRTNEYSSSGLPLPVGQFSLGCGPYADFPKRRETDAKGYFKFEGLDPDFLYDVILAAPGCDPQTFERVDPGGGMISAYLALATNDAVPGRGLHGRLLDPAGNPVAGAIVNLRGADHLNREGRFDEIQDIDPVAISDEAGRFVIYGKTAFESAVIEVEARGLARQVFPRSARGIVGPLPTGDKAHELRLTIGAALIGRLMQDGKPVAHAEIGLCGADRSGWNFVGHFEAGTDGEGRFAFTNLPPRQSYYLYGVMKSLVGRGALAPKLVQVEGDGATKDMGDLALGPSYAIEGQVRLTDNKAIPAHIRLNVGCDAAWDSAAVEVDQNGRFHFTGIPAEAIWLGGWFSGYHFSMHNASLRLGDISTLDMRGRFGVSGPEPEGECLFGLLVTNKTDLVIELDPGRPEIASVARHSSLGFEPLRGAEIPTEKPEIRVTGSVIDGATGQPLPQFTVTEGRNGESLVDFDWLPMRQGVFSNGTFTAYFTRQRFEPGLRIEADGYEPQSFGPIFGTGTNLTVALKKLVGTAGVVLKADGRVAPGVTVCLNGMGESVYLYEQNGKRLSVWDSYNSPRTTTQTDADGRFAFTPLLGAYSVTVADDPGFANVKLAGAVATNLIVRLQPWARLEGKLMIGSQPGTNEIISVRTAYIRDGAYRRAFVNGSTKTDGEGRFVFEGLPPLEMIEVNHDLPRPLSGVGIFPDSQSTRIYLQPGESRKLAIGGKGRSGPARKIGHR